MRIGLLIQRFAWPDGQAGMGRMLARIGREAEQAGISSIWLNDHFQQIQMFGAVSEPMLEAYTALGFLAAATDHVELGTLTTGATHRHPGVLLKTLTTLDALSGGRSWLGIGPPWNEREQRALGIPVLSWPERFERLEEVLQLAHQVLDGDPTPFLGKHYQLEDPRFSPPPVRRPPILIGGAHERRVLRLVARYGDACNLFENSGADGSAEMVGLKLRMLRRNCAELGRPFAEITITTYGSLRLSAHGRNGTQTLAQAVQRFGRLAEEGVQLAILDPVDVVDPASYELLADLVVAVRDLAPAGR